MKLDLRIATIVMTGAWNCDIFTPPWIAKYLFNYQEDQEVKGSHIIFQPDNGPPRTINYIDDIGVSAASGRLELFLKSTEQKDFNLLESVAKNAISVLKHTPMGAFGINFRFVEETPSTDLVDKLKARDNLDEHFEIKSETFTSTIAYAENVDLNLTRIISDEGVKLGFNYHSHPLSIDNAEVLISKAINLRYEETKELIHRLYDRLDDIGIITH